MTAVAGDNKEQEKAITRKQIVSLLQYICTGPCGTVQILQLSKIVRSAVVSQFLGVSIYFGDVTAWPATIFQFQIVFFLCCSRRKVLVCC